ncbi:hypothetical protein [Sphingomonas sp. GM_Shp_2]|uniref:hypothetical protein n=1 Tax=Sphingomonas sp. GM_Shp_2 TaxID=2937380 RepID=UPI0022699A30|nr:hypothetical protein [Sphingomonas sp. GM_Shp_2]
MKKNKLRFVVFSFPYDQDSGGGIALLLLCERLRELGFDAYIWPATTPYSLLPRSWKEAGKIIRRWRQLLPGQRFSTGPFSVPIATRQIVKDAVAVYPEVVVDNPLRSRKVVRWFLHRPGHHTGKVRYGKNELYFFYQDAFNDTNYNSNLDNRLTVTYLHPAYTNRGDENRAGTCVLIRKGKNRLSCIELKSDDIVDGMSHEETADHFNRSEYLQSLDTYSMYSVFAAMCGCTPVIEPVPGVTKEQWFPREEDRYGLAYGWDDVEWAINTRGLLLERLSQDRKAEDQMVVNFTNAVESFFYNGTG